MAVAKSGPVPGFGWGWLALALALWVLASVAGTVGEYLPREVFYSNAAGQPIEQCSVIQPDTVAAGQAEVGDWCTLNEVLGALPADVRFSTGSIIIDKEITFDGVADALLRPDLLLTIGVGGAALIFLFGFARATGTMRAGLAAAISVVFLGLLLFPSSFTFRIPEDMRSELVSAWQWVILFYFGSEAAVQAAKVLKGETAVGGDLTTTLAGDGAGTRVRPDHEAGAHEAAADVPER